MFKAKITIQTYLKRVKNSQFFICQCPLLSAACCACFDSIYGCHDCPFLGGLVLKKNDQWPAVSRGKYGPHP